MLEPAGDLRFEQEPVAADGVVGVRVEDLLECHLAVQFGVERHEYSPDATPRMRPQHAKPLAVGGGQFGYERRRAVKFAVLGRGVYRRNAAERRLDIGVANSRQALPRRLGG